MKNKYSVHRQETHYVTYDVYYDVEAETPAEAAKIAELHWTTDSSTASYLSDYSTTADDICRFTYAGGETLEVRTNSQVWDAIKLGLEGEAQQPAPPIKSYVLILTVGGQFFGIVNTFSSREAAEANAPILIANAKKQGYTNQFGDYYLDDEDYSYYIREVDNDAPIPPEEADDEESEEEEL